jgi:hypothetical protein
MRQVDDPSTDEGGRQVDQLSKLELALPAGHLGRAAIDDLVVCGLDGTPRDAAAVSAEMPKRSISRRMSPPVAALAMIEVLPAIGTDARFGVCISSIGQSLPTSA